MSRTDFDVKETHIGDGASAGPFSFDFKIEELAQLEIVEYNTLGVETQRVRGTDVTYLSGVTFSATLGAGTVTLQNPLTLNYTMLILLANDAPTQSFQFTDKGEFKLKEFEKALDKIAGSVQRLMYFALRSPRINDYDDESLFDSKLPSLIDTRGDSVLGINAAGTSFEFKTLAPYTVQSDAITVSDNEAAPVNFTGWTLDGASFRSQFIVTEIKRGTSYFQSFLSATFDGTDWTVVELMFSGAHGLVFSVAAGVSGQMKYTSDASGAGTIKHKGFNFTI